MCERDWIEVKQLKLWLSDNHLNSFSFLIYFTLKLSKHNQNNQPQKIACYPPLKTYLILRSIVVIVYTFFATLYGLSLYINVI